MSVVVQTDDRQCICAESLTSAGQPPTPFTAKPLRVPYVTVGIAEHKRIRTREENAHLGTRTAVGAQRSHGQLPDVPPYVAGHRFARKLSVHSGRPKASGKEIPLLATTNV
jgi:hypothetical protein